MLYSIHKTDNEAKAVFLLVYRKDYVTENLTVGVSAALVLAKFNLRSNHYRLAAVVC